jgi:hypothetical protein
LNTADRIAPPESIATPIARGLRPPLVGELGVERGKAALSVNRWESLIQLVTGSPVPDGAAH